MSRNVARRRRLLRLPAAACCIAALLCCAPLSAQAPRVTLAALFGDHMVLPRDVPVTLWGTGVPGDTVRIRIAGQTVTAHTDWDGRWIAQLAPMHAGGPFQMNVEVGGEGPLIPSSAANGTGGLELNDVLIGDLIPPQHSRADVPRPSPQPAASPPPPVARYAFIRVYHAGSWRVVRQGRLPENSETLFEDGQARYTLSGIPVGVVGTSGPARCPPSTACSSH